MSDGHTPLDSPALTIAIAALGGVTAQIVGRHTGLPGIVLLLTAGVVLGPDVLNLVRPEQLGDALQTLVGFAVAVILFEGGLALDLGRLRRAQKPVRRLVTIGALVTLILGTGVAYLATGWPLRVCFLFGTLIIVTGPTVVTPLLRRLQVEPKTATVLEAEGVLIDAVGAVTAAVALEAALQPSTENAIGALVDLGSTLAFGLVAGLIAGGILSFMFQSRRAIPDGLENIFALVFVLALFQVTNAVFHESGVAAVTAAGVVLARTQLPVRQDLHHFKEQLTAMFIGLLFVLLAADVRIADIHALGWSAVLAVLGVMIIVRPLSVAAGTFGSDLTLKQRTFVGWIGPRGIIAAAVASLFAGRLEAEGLPEGRALQAMVFAIIAVTVLWAGITGGFAAQWLGLRRPKDTGWVILGVNDVSLAVADALREGGEDILMIEADPHAVRTAEQDGFRALFGNPFEKRTVMRAQLSARTGVLALTSTEETNYLFAQRARKQGKLKTNLLALDSTDRGITEQMVERIEGELWAGAAVSISKWMQRLRAGQAHRQQWRVSEATQKLTSSALRELVERDLVLPLAIHRKGRAIPVGSTTDLNENDEIVMIVPADRNEEARASLETRAFLRLG